MPNAMSFMEHLRKMPHSNLVAVPPFSCRRNLHPPRRRAACEPTRPAPRSPRGPAARSKEVLHDINDQRSEFRRRHRQEGFSEDGRSVPCLCRCCGLSLRFALPIGRAIHVSRRDHPDESRGWRGRARVGESLFPGILHGRSDAGRAIRELQHLHAGLPRICSGRGDRSRREEKGRRGCRHASRCALCLERQRGHDRVLHDLRTPLTEDLRALGGRRPRQDL